MQLFEDRICGGSPLERLAVRVVRRDEVVSALHELFDASEASAPNCLVSYQREEALDLVEPRAVGRDEVHVPARPSCQPSLDLRLVVGGVFVGDAVDVQVGRRSLVNLAQERQELLMPVARLAGSQHPPLSTFSAANNLVVPLRL